MKYKKYLIVTSKQDKAGSNITTQLSQLRKNLLLATMDSEKPFFDFYLIEGETIYTENIDKERISKYDVIIFASRHESSKKEKTLSVHAPGNWREAKLGGEQGKICKSSALFQKFLFEKLNEKTKEFDLDQKYNVTLECTHHGPLLEKPCVYIEIGSTDMEWSDRRAAFVIAQTIKDTIENFSPNEYHEIGFGIGGPHYCPNFNKLQEKSNVALSHIIPSYALPLTEEMVKEVLEKTEEDIDYAVLDWKGIGGDEERKRIIKILDKFYIRYRKTSEIKKEI